VGFLIGFIVFFYMNFLKNLVFFWLGPVTSTLNAIMDV